MRRVDRLRKLEKAKYFSQKETETLSGFTRRQLRKLEEVELVVPQKNPILYTWNQLIFLRVLFEFRQDWTFKQLELICKEWASDSKGLNRLIETIDKSLAALLILGSDNRVNFQVVENITLQNDFKNHKLKIAIDNIRNNVKLNKDEGIAIIEYIARSDGDDDYDSRVSFKKQTLVIIPSVISNLKNLAKEIQIENFDTKVG